MRTPPDLVREPGAKVVVTPTGAHDLRPRGRRARRRRGRYHEENGTSSCPLSGHRPRPTSRKRRRRAPTDERRQAAPGTEALPPRANRGPCISRVPPSTPRAREDGDQQIRDDPGERACTHVALHAGAAAGTALCSQRSLRLMRPRDRRTGAASRPPSSHDGAGRRGEGSFRRDVRDVTGLRGPTARRTTASSIGDPAPGHQVMLAPRRPRRPGARGDAACSRPPLSR